METKNQRRLFLFYLFFLISLLSISFNTYSQEKLVYCIKIDGSINPSTSDYIHDAIETATSQNAMCLIIELNTPGGLLKSTRYIVSDILTSAIPIIVYVSPSGAQAGSAGVFITLAGNIAAMAPGTNIGASHPVGMDGKQDSIMNEKATNDAAAFIRSISEKRKRNIQWSEDAVRKSVSITDNEALNLNVIDLIASSKEELLEKINGKEVETSKGKIILDTKSYKLINYEMSWFQKFLAIISDPNIAYILMMIGIWGIILEFYNPGGILPGVIGVMCILLGLYGLHTLPLNYTGFALIVLAIILFIAEIKIVSHGMLTVGGVICLLLGSFMLIDIDSGLEFAEISFSVIITTVLIITILFVLLTYFVIKAHKKKIKTGEEGLIGEIGEVTYEIDKINGGVVKLKGELWNAVLDRNETENIPHGKKVKVTSIENLTIRVKLI